ILAGRLSAGDAIPSTRAMAAKLKVSRNTVAFAYQALVTGGFLSSKDRSGYCVSDTIAPDSIGQHRTGRLSRTISPVSPNWEKKLGAQRLTSHVIVRPTDWQRYPYPFVYGQLDLSLFPITAWRDCVRQAMSKK